MIALLGFVLECAAVAAAVGASVSLASWAAIACTRPVLSRLPAAHRASILFVAGLAPALATAAIVAAAALPSVVRAVGLAEDHCLEHSHHAHLCVVHFGGVRPAVAALGAVALAVFVFRLVSRIAEELRVAARLRAIEPLARRRDGEHPVLVVAGGPVLCHAVGVLRPRVVVASTVVEALTPAELDAALAHEHAHLRRREPLSLLVLRLAGAFALPILSRAFDRGFREASEEACDAEAVRALGEGSTLASAVVKVSRHQQRVGFDALPALGAHPLERRVRALLDATPADARAPLHVPLALGSAAVTAALSFAYAPAIHHAVESAIHHLS